MTEKKGIVMSVSAAAVMISAFVTANASSQVGTPAERGMTEIADINAGNITAAYCVKDVSPDNFGDFDAAEMAKMFDNNTETSVKVNRKAPEPYLGGFVLDAGEGKTFADVDEIELSSLNGNGSDIYIFGSNEDIAEAISQNKDKDLAGSNYENFISENLGIEVNRLVNAETAYYYLDDSYEVECLRGSYWGTYPLTNADYRYLYIGTPQWNKDWRIDEIKFMSYNSELISTGTSENCEIILPDTVTAGGEALITVKSNEGYVFGKLNVNGVTSDPSYISPDGKTAEYTISSVNAGTVVDAWADPEGRLYMNELTPDEFSAMADGITVYINFPEGFSDNAVSVSYDYASYPSFTVYDAGENNKYEIEKIITYARPNMPGRSHLKVYGTNEITSEIFSNSSGADTGKLTALTHEGNNFFGTGSWNDNKNTNGTDSVRGVYDVDKNEGYRYIVVASDHNEMLSLTELKLYGKVVSSELETTTSDYFAFEASEDEMNSFNKIAIEVNDTDWLSTDFASETIFGGSGSVKYAINITDLPQDKMVTDMKLYRE